MSTHNARLGHAAVAAILQDMDRYLPSAAIQRPGYCHIRQLYGLLNMTYRRIDTSRDPHQDYIELQALKRDLRRRLHDLDATKGIPAKMTQYLDELKAAIDDALARGIDTEFLVQGVRDIIEERPNARIEVQPDLAKMIPDTWYKKARADLAEAREMVRKLNEENNRLVMQVK